jgi:hypothetical protein
MIRKRRLTKNRDAKPGAAEGASVVGWLNDEKVNARERHEIEGLLRDLVTLTMTPDKEIRLPTEAELKRICALRLGFSADTPVREMAHLVREWRIVKIGPGYDQKVLARVKSYLARVRFRPVVWPMMPPHIRPTDLYLRMVPELTARRGLKGSEVRALVDNPLGIPIYASPAETKTWIVMLATQIANLHALDRIRQCQCGQWFYAARPDRRSCSAACRKAAYERTSERRDSRRKYMKKYMKAYREGSM